jgi:hypothetical protein
MRISTSDIGSRRSVYLYWPNGWLLGGHVIRYCLDNKITNAWLTFRGDGGSSAPSRLIAIRELERFYQLGGSDECKY